MRREAERPPISPKAGALANPFAPEQGQITAAGWVSRLSRNVAAVTPALGGAVTAQEVFWQLAFGTLNRVARRTLLPESAAFIPMMSTLLATSVAASLNGINSNALTITVQ